jgi:UDP-glucose 4-epimerase
MKADAADAFYNVGTGKKTTVKELAQRVLDMTGSQLEIQYDPGGTTFVKNRVGSTAKAEAELGFRADVDIAAGLRLLIDWRDQHKELVARQRARSST